MSMEGERGVRLSAAEATAAYSRSVDAADFMVVGRLPKQRLEPHSRAITPVTTDSTVKRGFASA